MMHFDALWAARRPSLGDPAPPVPPTPWPYVALLWLCVWSRNSTLLHIAKTGGTSLEAYDHSAPVRLFRWHRKHRQNGSFFAPDNKCSGFSEAMHSLWHWTSFQLDACGMFEQHNPYLQLGARRYCVIRDRMPPAQRSN